MSSADSDYRKAAMPTLDALNKRFSELADQLDAVAATKRYVPSEFMAGDRVDDHALLNWRVKARSLISTACGPNSEHYSQFVKSEEPRSLRTNVEVMHELSAVFMAAKEDYEGGYLASVRSLVQAELFSSELDQARELLNAGYASPAAVVAGVVLETGLRQLCADANISSGSLNKMNADLAKAGKYNLLVQKRITALADIRNNAAHGNPGQFNQDDVADMIAQVERFVTDYL